MLRSKFLLAIKPDWGPVSPWNPRVANHATRGFIDRESSMKGAGLALPPSVRAHPRSKDCDPSTYHELPSKNRLVHLIANRSRQGPHSSRWLPLPTPHMIRDASRLG